MLKKRASGVLLHVTSLPGRYGVGDLGPAAYAFLDFLKAGGQNYWQVLPLYATLGATGHSPYNAVSAFAGNCLLISPELLCRDGLLTEDVLRGAPAFPRATTQYGRAYPWRRRLLRMAFKQFTRRGEPGDYQGFVRDNHFWLDDYTLFAALSEEFGSTRWHTWPAEYRDRRPAALRAARDRLRQRIDEEIFIQYLFARQYSDLRVACRDRGIQLIGDIPIYVARHSADVWAHRRLFKLDRRGRPTSVAGVPPDYFSRTGQLWGNPVYDWEHLARTNFAWPMERIGHNLRLFDFVRIDHFRGLVAYWEVPAGHKTAQRGRWIQAPGHEFLSTLFRRFPFAPVLAEDLGHITPDVREAMTRFGLPGMRVLQFAFDGDPARNPHCLHNHVENCVVYTGTHDNNTTRGWFATEARAEQKRRLADYLGYKATAANVHWNLIHLAMASVAKVAMIPMQDLLGLGAAARMNYPSKAQGNWRWRMLGGAAGPRLAEKLARLVKACGRA